MNKEETLYTTKGVYLTSFIYKTKIPYMGYFSYINTPLPSTLTKKDNAQKRLLDGFKRVLHTTRYPFPLSTQKHNNATTKKGATTYNNKHGSPKKHGIYIKNPQKPSSFYVITHKRQNGWGTNYFNYHSSQSDIGSPSMPPNTIP